jgi:hypothetical protein
MQLDESFLFVGRPEHSSAASTAACVLFLNEAVASCYSQVLGCRKKGRSYITQLVLAQQLLTSRLAWRAKASRTACVHVVLARYWAEHCCQDFFADDLVVDQVEDGILVSRSTTAEIESGLADPGRQSMVKIDPSTKSGFSPWQ